VAAGFRGADRILQVFQWEQDHEENSAYRFIRKDAIATDTLSRNGKGAAAHLRQQIEKGIKEYGIVETEDYGKIYAYEVDGFGQYNLMDDANIPSLLSMPYLGYRGDRGIMQSTRRFILSEANPCYYQGKYARGIGSPHTPKNHVWPLALIMQGMTSTDKKEKEDILRMLSETDAETGLMHESMHVDDPKKYTREWFSWANALFCECILDFCGYGIVK